MKSFTLLLILLNVINLQGASYILDYPEKIKEGGYPTLIQKNKTTYKGIIISTNEDLKVYIKEPIKDITQLMTQIDDKVLVFKPDTIHLDKLNETTKVQLNKNNYKVLREMFPQPQNNVNKTFKYLLPYGIRIAPAALMFGAPISVALVGQGVITDIIIHKQEKAFVTELKSKINSQELRINNLVQINFEN